jgi:glycosyltransferase involved in cell wall biosynthesis
MTIVVAQVLVGPRRHGVVQFGLVLDAAVRRHIGHTQLTWVPDATGLSRRIPAESQVIHTQFTDRLFGADPDAAAAALVRLAKTARARGSAFTVTLHDLPQPSDGVHHEARVRAYRTVISASDRIVVSSEHERDLLRENGLTAGRVRVIPLPISPDGYTAPRPGIQPTTLGVFGFIYPGKGHEDVIAATQGLSSAIEVHALGDASPGHGDLVAHLRRSADRLRRPFQVTGHIAKRNLAATLRAITIPVTAHRHVSASGSINTWHGAGRRPLAPATRYTAEVERRNPGSLLLFEDTPSGLRNAIREALADPSSTWLAAGAALYPTPSEAASCYADMFRSVAG